MTRTIGVSQYLRSTFYILKKRLKKYGNKTAFCKLTVMQAEFLWCNDVATWTKLYIGIAAFG